MFKISKTNNFKINHFIELYNKSINIGYPLETDFLTLFEQNEIKNSLDGDNYIFFGGHAFSERKICIFGLNNLENYILNDKYVRISPINEKFSEKLSHKDFLGSIMALGIDRSKIGDLIVQNNICYTIIKEDLFEYLCDNLCLVKHTLISCEEIELFPDDIIPKLIDESIVVTSERLDSIISSLFKISRSVSKSLIESEKVLINGKETTKNDIHLLPNDIITVKSYGKFIFENIICETKKGRLRVVVKKFV